MYNPRWLFFIPGGTLCALGAVLAALLFSGPLQLADGLSLDLNTFVAACFMLVAGIQLVTFGVLSRYYAAITGVLPDTPGSQWLTRQISTDRLALAAGACLLAGVLFFGYAMMTWANAGFGHLAEASIPRIVVFGLTLVVVALQSFFSAFLLGILEIPVRRPRPRTGQAGEPSPRP
jgi:hypothetical protein